MNLYKHILFSLVLCSFQNTAVAGNLKLKWAHIENAPVFLESSYLSYVNWEAFSTLYKEVFTKNDSDNQAPEEQKK